MRNRVLIFGGSGWLANEFAGYFTEDVAIVTHANILDIDAVRSAVKLVRPDVVINAAGKTGRPNIDWCEATEENRRLTQYVNDFGVAILREVVCPYAKLVHLSSGCLWEEATEVTEETEPEPPSWYSETKADGDARLEGTDALVLRLRMPFDGSGNPRCLLTKLSKYDDIISYPNSLTFVADLLDATKYLVENGASGIFNVVNTGAVSAEFIMREYCRLVDPHHTYSVVPVEDLLADGKMTAKRSNCVLSNQKLFNAGFWMEDATIRVIQALKRLGGKGEA